MTTCPDEDTFSAFLEQRLPPQRFGELQLHIDGCSRCRRLYAALAKEMRDGPLYQAAEASDSKAYAQAREAEDDLDGLIRGLGSGAAGPTGLVQPGDLLAGRYRVVRFLAAGGMGEVFEAKDVELGTLVALKAIRPGIASEAGVIDRLKRETQLARQVTHPNVCRIFDLGHHQLPSGDRVSFLTMELLSGESLAERLKRGPLNPEEGKPIALQMAAALEAAHQARVIHRDFKTSNVMLVTAEDGPRAVVTDFGLARSESEDRGRLTVTGGFLGTPAYMSPEQVEGAALTAASDVYSFGVVVFEMVTGILPFDADTPLAMAAKRLRENPPSPRRYTASLPSAWERTILACLSRNPDHRPRVAEIPVLLRGKRPGLVRRALVVAGLAVVLGISVTALWSTFADETPEPGSALIRGPRATAPPAARARPSIAVLGFENATGRNDLGWLSEAIGETLTAELSLGGGLRTILPTLVARTKRDLALAENSVLTPQLLDRLRLNLNTDYVVSGRYRRVAGSASTSLGLEVHLHDALRGTILTSLAVSGSEGGLKELVEDIGRRLRQVLVIPEPPTTLRGSWTSDMPDAQHAYARGLARLHAFDWRGARRLLERAVSIDPRFPKAYDALASALDNLGETGKKRAAAQRAFEQATALSEEDRLLLEARYRSASGERDKEAEIYARLFHLFPDNPEYGIRLARAQTEALKPAASLETVAALRRLPAPLGSDPRIDYAEARAAGALAFDLARSYDAAQRTIRAGVERGARLIVGKAHLEQGVTLTLMGRATEAVESYSQGRRIFQGLGESRLVGWALLRVGLLRFAEGRLSQALASFRRAVEALEKSGDRMGYGFALSLAGHCLRFLGRIREAREALAPALVTLREIEAGATEAHATNFMGDVLFELGDLAGARQAHERASGIVVREWRMPPAYPHSERGVARIELVEGKVAAAKARVKALASVRRPAVFKPAAVDLLSLRFRLHLATGDIKGARALVDETVALWRKGGARSGVENRALLMAAEVDIERRRPAEALRLAEAAALELRREGLLHEEAWAHALRARAHRTAGDLRSAQKAIASARAARKAVESVPIRLRIGLEIAEMKLAARDGIGAQRAFHAVEREAHARGFRVVALEARIGEARAMLISTPAGKGRERLRAAREEAFAAGLRLLVRRAELTNGAAP
jgi:tetratricopeptide (TPR) repeat protein